MLLGLLLNYISQNVARMCHVYLSSRGVSVGEWVFSTELLDAARAEGCEARVVQRLSWKVTSSSAAASGSSDDDEAD